MSSDLQHSFCLRYGTGDRIDGFSREDTAEPAYVLGAHSFSTLTSSSSKTALASSTVDIRICESDKRKIATMAVYWSIVKNRSW